MRGQKAEGRGQKCFRARAARVAAFWFLVSGFWFPGFAKNGAFTSTAHGDKAKGPQRRFDVPRGSCAQCHQQHPSHDPTAPQVSEKALFTADDNNLCFVCHGNRSDDGVFPGNAVWWQSSHALSPAVVRPGADPRSPADVNKCVNCHDPHGVKDGYGVVPSMLVAREPDVCTVCHDGSRARDLTNDLGKPYRHPIGQRRTHNAAAEAAGKRSVAIAASDRHSDCSDCHNAHTAVADRVRPAAPLASGKLAGVTRVEVTNSGAGVAPRYTWRDGSDTSDLNEYEVCFKCHSSWTRQPPGQSDLALLTNPANPSYHPIQAQGKNRIDPSAFANGFTSESVITCVDCHSSDDPTVRAPHGSQYRFILRKPSTPVVSQQQMTHDDICFDCHAWSVYGDAAANEAAQRSSRFNAPALAGHAFHVGAQRIPCYACHETHGSTRNAALIARRIGGILSYTQTSAGGTCSSLCHAPKTYAVNYPR